MKKVLVFVIILQFLPILAFAASDGYQPLAPIPALSGGGSSAGASDGDIAGYLRNLYSFGVAAAAGLAVIMVILGGIQYITSVSGEGKGGGKDRITSAILGLLLALGSYIILKTINKDLLELDFEFNPDALKGTPNVGPDYGQNALDIANAMLNQSRKDLETARQTYAEAATNANILTAQSNANLRDQVLYNRAQAATVAAEQARRAYLAAQTGYNTAASMYTKAYNLGGKVTGK